MAGTTPKPNKKTSKPKGENGKKPKSLTDELNEKVNAAEERVQEIEEKNKPKRGKIAELTKQLEEAAKRAEEAEKRAKEADKKTEEANKKIKELETLRDEYSKSFFKRNQELAAAEKQNKQLEADRNVTADALRTSQNRIKELEDSNNVYINGAKSLVNRQKALREDYENIKKDKERLSKVNQDYRTQNSYLTEALRQGTLKSDKEVTDAVNAIEPKAEEVKTDNSEGDLSSSRDVEAELNEILKAIGDGRISDAQKLADQAAKKYRNTSESKTTNSGTAEETVTPETGEAKVEGEPEVKTEQAQATQEPAKEANTTSGTGEATADNMMTPEDAYNYFKNKDNYEKASNVFETPSFNEYIDSNTGKWIPRGYFDAYNAKDGINPKKFTFEHFKAKIPEDLSKKLTSAEATEELAKRNAALKSYDEEYKKFNSGFQAYLRKHPKLANALKWGAFGALGEGAVEFGKWLNETYMAGQNDKDELQNIINGLNDDEPEYPGSSSGSNSPEDIAAQLKGANESTETPEGDSGTIEQAIAEQAPAGNVEPENPQVASNEATPTNTKANNAPASTAESAPTQGLPPVVTRDAPPANPDSSGMTYSQRVEAAGQAPQAGSMAYNANNPDMDATGYGDLYDQNFIDFWAKRNPNLAYAVSQGRKS